MPLQIFRRALFSPLKTDRRASFDRNKRRRRRHPDRILPAPIPARLFAAPGARRKERHIRPFTPRPEAETRLSLEGEVEEWKEDLEEEDAAGEEHAEPLMGELKMDESRKGKGEENV